VPASEPEAGARSAAAGKAGSAGGGVRGGVAGRGAAPAAPGAWLRGAAQRAAALLYDDQVRDHAGSKP